MLYDSVVITRVVPLGWEFLYATAVKTSLTDDLCFEKLYILAAQLDCFSEGWRDVASSY